MSALDCFSEVGDDDSLNSWSDNGGIDFSRMFRQRRIGWRSSRRKPIGRMRKLHFGSLPLSFPSIHYTFRFAGTPEEEFAAMA
jgi:hypothetical protein